MKQLALIVTLLTVSTALMGCISIDPEAIMYDASSYYQVKKYPASPNDHPVDLYLSDEIAGALGSIQTQHKPVAELQEGSEHIGTLSMNARPQQQQPKISQAINRARQKGADAIVLYSYTENSKIGEALGKEVRGDLYSFKLYRYPAK